MEFLQLKYFCEAADMQNISRAAKLYGVPASGVSSSIKRLEQELGVKLFCRYSNQVKLTEQGKIFYEEARCILDDLNRAVSRIESVSSVAGKITLCVTTCNHVVERAITEFKKEYPDVGFELHRNTIRSGNTDFYISDELFYFRGCLKETLCEENMVFAARKDHPLLQADEIDISALKKEKFVCTNAGTSIYHRVSSICFDNGFVPNITMSAATAEESVKFIAEGYGIGIFPASDVRGYDKLSYRVLGKYKRKVCVFYDGPRLDSKPNKLFLEKLLEVSAAV